MSTHDQVNLALFLTVLVVVASVITYANLRVHLQRLYNESMARTNTWLLDWKRTQAKDQSRVLKKISVLHGQVLACQLSTQQVAGAQEELEARVTDVVNQVVQILQEAGLMETSNPDEIDLTGEDG